MRRFERHIDIVGEGACDGAPIRQSVTDFIFCQHSRKTFTRRIVGARAPTFDAELRNLLTPYATPACLEYSVRTRLHWGRLRA